jgi:hypothetical protein
MFVQTSSTHRRHPFHLRVEMHQSRASTRLVVKLTTKDPLERVLVEDVLQCRFKRFGHDQKNMVETSKSSQ